MISLSTCSWIDMSATKSKQTVNGDVHKCVRLSNRRYILPQLNPNRLRHLIDRQVNIYEGTVIHVALFVYTFLARKLTSTAM
jgi:hypothetical protein